jgi:hypothetical protein
MELDGKTATPAPRDRIARDDAGAALQQAPGATRYRDRPPAERFEMTTPSYFRSRHASSIAYARSHSEPRLRSTHASDRQLLPLALERCCEPIADNTCAARIHAEPSRP